MKEIEIMILKKNESIHTCLYLITRLMKEPQMNPVFVIIFSNLIHFHEHLLRKYIII